jgi:hypothetical protein
MRAARLRLHALAYNLAHFLRTLATPEAVETWSLTSLRDRLIKTGTRLVRLARGLDSRGIRGCEGQHRHGHLRIVGVQREDRALALKCPEPRHGLRTVGPVPVGAVEDAA